MDGLWHLLQIGLTNAAAAAALALPAGAVSAIFRRPALTRALWALVLLKLMAPPVWVIHIHRPAAPAPVPPVLVNRAAAPAPLAGSSSPVVDEETEAEDSSAETPAAEVTVPAVQSRQPERAPSYLALHWPMAVAVLWLTGSVLYVAAAAVGTVRLRRVIKLAAPAPIAIRQRVQELATRIGLRRAPEVWLVSAAIPPMLWIRRVIGTPALLLPAELWRRLDEGERDAVLAHELAHLRRRDHWLRALELLASVLYWWHPVVWWARRELREATEQCCDAWVLSAVPRCRASYAAALLEAIDFLSSASKVFPARPAVPALASGMGQFTNLKRRLIMIRQGTMRGVLGWPAFTAVCGLAGVLLPLSASVGQTATDTAPAATSAATTATASQTTSATVSADTAAPATSAEAAENGENAENAVKTTTGTIAAETASDDEDEIGTVSRVERADPSKLAEARQDVERLRSELKRAEERLASLEGRHLTVSRLRSYITERRVGIGRQPTAGRVGATAGSGTASQNRSANEEGPDQRRRLDLLEGQLRQMLDELRELKREMRHDSGGERHTEAAK